MNEVLVESVLRLVEEIPEGTVATYGMIARVVGTGPRIVGRIMAQWGDTVPWWRVVNVHGKFPQALRNGALARWEAEGIPTVGAGEQVNLTRCLTDESYLVKVFAEIQKDLKIQGKA